MHFSRTSPEAIVTRLSAEEQVVIGSVLGDLVKGFGGIDQQLFRPAQSELESLAALVGAAAPLEELLLSPAQYMLLLDAISYADDTFGTERSDEFRPSIGNVRNDMHTFRRRPRAVLRRAESDRLHSLHDELFPIAQDIELDSVFLERDFNALKNHDSERPIANDRYLYVVFLYFRDAKSNPARIRCWCEFTTTAPANDVAELDAFVLTATLDLLRDAIVPASERLELLWNHGQDAVNEQHGWDEIAEWKATKTLTFGEFRFSGGYCTNLFEREEGGQITACQALTGVFYRGGDEFWATASAGLQFSPKIARCERDFATYQRSKQVFAYASTFSLEQLVSKVSEEPAGGTNVAFQPWE